MVIQKCSFRGSLLLRVSFFSWHCPPRFCGTYRHNITSWCVLKSELLFLAFAWFEHLLYVQCECCAWSSMTSFLTPTFLFTVFQQGPMCIASQAGHFRVMVGAIKFFCFFLVVFFFLQMLFIGQIVQHYSLIGPVINVNVLVRDYSSILVYKCSLVLSWLAGIALSSEVVSVARWERKLNTACSDVGGKADIRNTRCLRNLAPEVFFGPCKPISITILVLMSAHKQMWLLQVLT